MYVSSQLFEKCQTSQINRHHPSGVTLSEKEANEETRMS